MCAGVAMSCSVNSTKGKFYILKICNAPNLRIINFNMMDMCRCHNELVIEQVSLNEKVYI